MTEWKKPFSVPNLDTVPMWDTSFRHKLWAKGMDSKVSLSFFCCERKKILLRMADILSFRP